MHVADFTEQVDRPVAHRHDGDRLVVSVDLGPGTPASVDVTGSTALVVLGTGADEQVHEIVLPSPDAEAFIHNGVLTIDVKEDAE